MILRKICCNFSNFTKIVIKFAKITGNFIKMIVKFYVAPLSSRFQEKILSAYADVMDLSVQAYK